jgi:transcriptional regulator with XRE-family HTH domain
MSEPDSKTTLRELREYVDLSYEPPREFAARIGIAKETIWYWLSGRRQPKAKSLGKLRTFLDAEAKRALQGDGIRPVEPVPYKIIRPCSALSVLPEGAGQDSQARR